MLNKLYTTFVDILPERLANRLHHDGFKRYFKNTGWLFATRIINMAIAFFVTAYVGRYLGPTNYGMLSYAFSFVGLFSFIATLGLDLVLFRDLIKYPERENEFLGSAIVIRVIGGIVASAVVVTSAFLLPEEPIIHALIFIISTTYVFQAFNVLNYTFQARVESKYPSIITLIVVVILSALKIAVVFYGKGVYYLAAVYAIEPVLYGIFLLWFYKALYGNPLRWHFDARTAKEMLLESFPLVLSSVFVIIYSRIDQVILKHMIDVTAVGLYDAAVRLSEVWYFLPGVIVGSVLPSIINAKMTDEKMYAKRVLYLTAFLIVVSATVGLVVTLLAKFIITLVFGAGFIGGAGVLQLYVWSGVGISIGAVLNQYLVAEKLTSMLLYTSIIGMVLNVVLNFVLIPHYGINGSALATLVSYILGPLSVMIFPSARRKIVALFTHL